MTAVEPDVSSPSFSREGKVVRDLAISAGPTKQFILGQAQTWLDAFRLFRELENRIGLPETERDKRGYFMLLTLVLSSGEYLLGKLDGNDRVLIQFTGISRDAFEGCVDLLRDSLRRLNRGKTPEEIKKLTEAVFDEQAAA